MVEKSICPLREFILSFCKRQKIRDIYLDNFDSETSIDLDFNIHGLDIDLFIAEFSNHFEVDITRFNWSKYGYPNGSVTTSILRTVFGYTPLVRKIAQKIYRPKLKIGDLQQALKTGFLV